MIYTLALSEVERDRIIQILNANATKVKDLDRQVCEAFTRGSIDNTNSPDNSWAFRAIEQRNNFYDGSSFE